MQLDQKFTIPTDVESAWKLLLDVEKIAPCFPGAKVNSVKDDTVNGQVKVKLGPIMLTYAGVLKFVERDDEAHVLVIDGQGTDAKGNGSASAKVTAQLTDAGPGETLCVLVTELNITGRPAQFGRGMMLEIGNNILGKFSANLAKMLTAEEAVPTQAGARGLPEAAQLGGAVASDAQAATGVDVTAGESVRTVSRHAAIEESEALDLLSAARGATLKRAIPALAGVAAVVVLIIWLAHR